MNNNRWFYAAMWKNLLISIMILVAINNLYSQSTLIKDENDNSLIEIHDEGNYGSITIYPWITGDEPQSPIDNKLFNQNGDIYWGANRLGFKGASGWADDGIAVKLLSSSDNVGIGTNTPFEKLDVVGNVNLSGIIKMDEFSFLSNTGVENLFVGKNAGYNNPLGKNTFIGFQSGYSNTGESNTFVGYNSGFMSEVVEYNTFFGYRSGNSNIAGNNNTYLGYEAGYSVNGNHNTYIGSYSGYGSSSAGDNTFIGVNSGAQNSGGDYGVFCGKNAGFNNGGSDKNTFIGAFSGSKLSGSHNTFIGYRSGQNNGGSSGIFIGFESGKNAVGNDLLYIENSDSATPLIGGNFNSDEIYLNGNVGIGTNTPDEKFEIEFEVGAVDIDIEIGQGVIDTDITFFKLTSPNGTPYWLYVNAGGTLVASATKP